MSNESDIESVGSAKARRVELILASVERLPTLSGVARRVLEVGSDDEIDLGELIRLIESDASLTARVLGMCRRADLGISSSITTVERAVKLLGLEAIRSAVLSVEVYGALDSDDDDGFDRVGYWRFALGVASAAEMLAERSRELGVEPSHAFVAGMLHGLGRVVLHRVLPKGYQNVVRVAESRSVDAAEVEQDLIGIDHHTAGKRLAEHWGLPHALQDVIWLHGQPTAAIPDLPHAGLIRLVRAAVGLCRALRIGWSGDFSLPEAVSEVAGETGFAVEVVDGVAALLTAAVAGRCEALGIEERTGEELLLESIASANAQLARINERLEVRVKQAGERGVVLAAIESFCRRDSTGETVLDALRAVALNAAGVFGRASYGAVVQPRRGAAWEVVAFGGGVSVEACEPPTDPGGEPIDLVNVFSSGRGDAKWVGRWARERLEKFPGGGRSGVGGGDGGGVVHWHPLWSMSERGRAPEGFAAVLASDRGVPAKLGGTGLLDALRAVWGRAVLAAGQHEGARRLGEKLAESQRRLNEMQHQLAERATMARLEQITAGCAHEMNNPLTVILGEVQRLSTELRGPDLRSRAERIGRAARGLSDLVTSLHVLSSPREAEFRSVHAGELVRDAVAEARQRMGGGVNVRLVVGEGLSAASVDREFLTEAVVELLRNAEESGSDGLTEVAVHAGGKGGRLEIRVKDRGRGMEPDVLHLAFDPFFSRRVAGRGAGLGLTRARRFVELMGGTLTLESVPDEGTTATISLPLRVATMQLLSDEGVRDVAA